MFTEKITSTTWTGSEIPCWDSALYQQCVKCCYPRNKPQMLCLLSNAVLPKRATYVSLSFIFASHLPLVPTYRDPPNRMRGSGPWAAAPLWWSKEDCVVPDHIKEEGLRVWDVNWGLAPWSPVTISCTIPFWLSWCSCQTCDPRHTGQCFRFPRDGLATCSQNQNHAKPVRDLVPFWVTGPFPHWYFHGALHCPCGWWRRGRMTWGKVSCSVMILAGSLFQCTSSRPLSSEDHILWASQLPKSRGY